ncbi:class C sortase [Pseudogracilibacillus auburnensis]|uniref:LPXTG-site transpeptidase (Sortase) family protein n=2 Tax=Pseudogracilibacillus auburnensis TaxID=1494959 RepID=A0A2V3VXE1_9BACI|nr:class C sortase [Pseudogracilibacillus auburnensis]PXW86250.1 LPXTG-site transpeptidase (sortase) family protein [Pseudogracilibacillus auburnensis]
MRKRSTIIVIFSLGIIVILYPHIAQWVNSYLQKGQVEDFHNIEMSDDELDQLMAKAQECNEHIFYDSEGFRDPFGDNEEKLQQFQECLGLYEDMFAAIEIPKLKLVIPIFLGATDEILSKGIGQVEGSSLPIGGSSTYTVLAGHRGMGTKAMFRNVDELYSGDIFYIHTLDGTLTYEVYDQKVIYPDETDSLEIEQDKDLATLLTCHPYRHNYQRLLIHGERTD